jgi:hypothetical protein
VSWLVKIAAPGDGRTPDAGILLDSGFQPEYTMLHGNG